MLFMIFFNDLGLPKNSNSVTIYPHIVPNDNSFLFGMNMLNLLVNKMSRAALRFNTSDLLVNSVLV